MKAANADEKKGNDFQERTIIIIIFIQEAPLTEVFFREGPDFKSKTRKINSLSPKNS